MTSDIYTKKALQSLPFTVGQRVVENFNLYWPETSAVARHHLTASFRGGTMRTACATAQDLFI